ncbi:MAG: hypothetical protein AAF566_13940, partial [Pseudomonadota bacterium]
SPEGRAQSGRCSANRIENSDRVLWRRQSALVVEDGPDAVAASALRIWRPEARVSALEGVIGRPTVRPRKTPFAKAVKPQARFVRLRKTPIAVSQAIRHRAM